MDIQDVIGQFEPDWKPRVPRPIAGSRLPRPVLGDGEGAVEWDNRENGFRMFVRMDTYDDLRNPRALFLFGRRGTGKTTYLRMLDHEVRANEVAHYSTSCVLESQPLLLGMSAQVRSSPLAALPDAELAEALIPIWHWVISVAAMQATVDAETPRAFEPVEIKRLRGFLTELLGPVTADASPYERLRDRMHELLALAVGQGQWTTVSGDVISNINQVFADQTFERAAAILGQLVSKRPCLVMLDAGDVYSIKDPIPSAAITALIAEISKLALHVHRYAVFAKAAFPSEILPHVYMYNRGKMEKHIVVISWTYRDLVALLAKRFAMLGGALEGDDPDLDNIDAAHMLIYSVLPAAIQTRVGIPFDTLAYIIRHTQRTPRQVLMLVNSVLTHAQLSGWKSGTVPNGPEVVVDGVHIYLGQLVNDAIDMHRSIYQRLDDIIQGTLARRPAYFSAKHLARFVKEVSNVRHMLGWQREEVVGLLFEVGVIGIAHEMHPLSSIQPSAFLLEALYEYQVKQTLVPSPDSYCVVHPMFYEWLGTRVDAKTFVYPVAFEDAEREVLARYGVRSAPV